MSHYFYKEYQARGAPHYHILLWIEGAPVAGVNDDEVVLQWIPKRITCHIPKPTTNPINNYKPVLLLLWNANIDLQFVGESSLAVAQYVTGYVTKAERSNMQDLWQEVSSHSSVYSKLFSFGVHSLRSGSVVSMRPATSSWEITYVASLRPSSGLMCLSHSTGRED